MAGEFTIAHLTDVHLGPVVGLSPRYWSLKRTLGYTNWVRRRQFVHDPAFLGTLCADVLEQRPDHILVTGDLTNLGLPAEHAQALAWLQTLGPPDRVSVIPGNHDIYTHLHGDEGYGRWRPYMTSDEPGAVLAPRAWAFPYVRRLGPIAIIGLNSAVPTPPFVAAGQLGATQRDRLAQVLDAAGSAGLFRLVMIHHPPLPGQTSPLRALRDAAALREVIGRHGADLVVHGHNHRPSLATVPAREGSVVPVVGGASASLARLHKHDVLGRYNLYTISGPPWRIDQRVRGLAEPNGRILPLGSQSLGAGPAGAL